ncbi:trypsin-like peptidase domain-containing protein [Singulisphaera sp. PoT]|uniref:trypsin-like peptidase domain-containing protein n=1 Tax=Singulisphaera sp. PoT TaxID=3411797 RepID=UPI003BF502EB
MSQETWYVRDRNKVTGPFNAEQLYGLRRRGQLAQFHEVSRDRVTWSRASTLDFLFSPQSVPRQEVFPVADATPEQPSYDWYYSSGQTPMGPVETANLLEMLRRGTITGETLVWREGLPNWVPLRTLQLEQPQAAPVAAAPAGHGGPQGYAPTPQHTAPAAAHAAAPAPAHARPSEAQSRNRRIGLIVAVVAIVIMMGIAAVLLAPKERREALVSGLKGDGSATINSVNDAPDLAAAVGLVLCGWVQTEFDGTRTEVCLSSGTCFVASGSGYLITNRHVVESTSKLQNAELMRTELEEKTKTKIEPKIWVFFKHKKYEATIVHESDPFDMAILKIKPDAPLPHFRLAEEDTTARGTPVYALGFPEASRTPLSGEEAIQRLIQEQKKGVRVESHFQPSNFEYVITDGIISLLRRNGGSVKIEHTAKISPGNSGGPLVRDDGTVVGINTLIVKGEEGASPTFVAQGIGSMRDELMRQAPEIFQP